MADLLPSSPDPSAGDGGEPRVIGVDSEEADDLIGALQSETARDLLAILYDEPATPSELADAADTSIQNVRYHLEKLTDADLVEVADTIYSEKGREMKVYAPAAKPLVVFAGGEDETPGIEAALSSLLGGLGVLGLSSLVVQRVATRGSLVPNVGFSAGGGAGDAAEATTEGDPAWQGSNVSATTELEQDAATEKVAETTRYVEDGGQTTAEATGTATEATRTGTEATRTATEATQTVPEATTTATEAVRRTTEEAARVTTTAAEATTAADTTTVTEAAGGAASALPPGLLFFAGGLVVLLGFVAAQYLRAR